MKKFMFFLIPALLIGLGQIRFSDEYVKAGNFLEMHINVVNEGKYDAEDVSVKVHIFGLGFLTSHSFDVDDKDNYGLFLDYKVPYNAKKGEYLVKITASNDDFRDIEYRYITIV